MIFIKTFGKLNTTVGLWSFLVIISLLAVNAFGLEESAVDELAPFRMEGNNWNESCLGRDGFIIIKNIQEGGLYTLSNISSDPKDFSNPAFKIDRNRIIEGDKVIQFDKFLKENKVKIENLDWGKRIPIDSYDFLFVKKGPEIGISFQSFDKDIVELKNKNQKLYFKIPKSFMDEPTYALSFSNLFAEVKQQKKFDIELAKYPDFKKFINELRQCIQGRNEDCIAKNVNLERIGLSKQAIAGFFNENMLKRYLMDDPKTCTSYREAESKEHHSVPKGSEKFVDKSRSKVWDSLDKALSLDLKYNFVDFTTRNFMEGINVIKVFKKPLKSLACKNTVDANFTFIKVDGKWYIEQVDVSNVTYPFWGGGE